MQRIIKNNRVRVGDLTSGDAAARAAHAGGHAGHGAGESSTPRAPRGVKLVRADGRVRAIEVTCHCGEVSILELDYDDSPTQA